MRPDAVTRAHTRLRALIVRGAIAPGSELSQVELARRAGVSTTPLREALQRLEAEGLVESRRNRRPRVRPFEVEDLDSVYAARVLLESLALRVTVPRLLDDDLLALRESLAAMRRADSRGEIAAWERAHEAFHLGLVARAAPSLREQIETLMARADRYRRLGIRGDTPSGRAAGDAEHAAILAACEDGDARRAAGLLTAQLARAARTVRARMAPDGELTALDAALETTYDG